MKETFEILKDIMSTTAYKFFLCVVAIVAFILTLASFKTITASNTMYPTFEEGQKVIIRKEDDFTYGDIVAYKSEVSDAYLIRRVIGLPGDTVLFNDHKLYINGTEVDEPYARYADDEKEPYLENIVYTVGENEYFLCGDNRNFSIDSRVSGSIDGSKIFGLVVGLVVSE